MRCEGFPEENYQLYSLGVLEADDAVDIDDHLAQKCETCSANTGASLYFWSLFGRAVADASVDRTLDGPLPFRLQPSSLRSAPIPISSAGKRPAQGSWWQWVGVAASFAVLVGALSWITARSFYRNEPQVVRHVEPPPSGQRAAELQSIDDLKRQLEASQRRLSEAEAARTSAAGQQGRVGGSQEQAMAAIRRNAQRQSEALTAARRRVEEIDRQLGSQRTALASAEQERTRLQGELSSARRDQQQARSDLAKANAVADARLAAATAQVRQLEQQRTSLTARAEQRGNEASQGQRVGSLLASPGTRVVRVTGTEAAPSASGYVLIGANQSIFFAANNLPALQGNRDYQLWFIRDSAPAIVSGGVFQVRAGQPTQLQATSRYALAGVRAIAVTDEPKGGSATPTRHKVLAGLPGA